MDSDTTPGNLHCSGLPQENPGLLLAPWQIATLAGMYNIVTAFASFAVGPLYDAYGRKVSQ